MKPSAAGSKCLNCKRIFVPDYRNRGRQRYCSATACQRVSKRLSQQRWLSLPANQDYFRGADHVKRVQQWRAEHPGYWKHPGKKRPGTLQEPCSEQSTEGKQVAPKQDPQASGPALQDLFEVKTPLLVGLIAQLTDSPLQEDIVVYTRHLIAKGQDILDQPSRKFRKGNCV